MKKALCRLLFFILLGMYSQTIAQNIPVGSWRTHHSYHEGLQLAEVHNLIYCVSASGLFTFDKENFSVTPFTKDDGLSDTGICRILAIPSHEMLVVAYTNGNIDFIEKDQIVNVKSILNASYPDKTIYDLDIWNNYLMISTAFGIVQFDIENYELKETWDRLGTNGELIPIHHFVSTADRLYALSNQLLLEIDATEVNKKDFHNWTETTVFDRAISSIKSYAEGLVYVKDQQGVYTFKEGIEQPMIENTNARFGELSIIDDELWIPVNDEIQRVVNGHSDIFFTAVNSTPQFVLKDETDHYWFADLENGLVQIVEDKTKNYYPSGTLSTAVFNGVYAHGKVLLTAGGHKNTAAWNSNAAAYLFSDGKWVNFAHNTSLSSTITLPVEFDLSYACFDTYSNLFFATTYQGQLISIHPETLEIIEYTIPYSVDKLGGIVSDEYGTLWLTAHQKLISYDQATKAFTVKSISTLQNPTHVLMDDWGQIWARLETGGVFVYKDGISRVLSDQVGQGGFPSRNIRSMAKLDDGGILFGTEDGVAEIYNPYDALTSTVDAIIPRYDGYPLLNEEAVTAMAIDGGDRKWLATNKGVWLFSEDNSEIIAYFTASNSLLLSDNIRDITINHSTGEVFFLTDQGVISYRGTATLGEEKHKDVKVFPNPVRPHYTGNITISGLVKNARLKITDTAGKLIYQTTAAGGTAVWNGLDYNGKRAATGVYFIFSTDKTGEESFLSKVAIVN